jgi:hypothetical protein
MRRALLLSGCALAWLAIATPARSQGAAKVPVVSGRSYVGGSAKVTVTGSFQFDADIAINTKASFGDGEMTWLQFGVSGSEPPEALITVSTEEVGISIGRGKQVATVGADACTGKMEVTATLVTGHYTCLGVPSHDPAAGLKLGKVNIEIRFTAKS